MVTGVEMFRKLLDEGQAGDNVGLLAAGGGEGRGGAGDGDGGAGSDHAAHEVQGGGVRVEKEEGGRHTPFFNGYRPQFYFRTTDVTGSVKLPEGVEMVMPGDNVKMDGGTDHADRDGEGVAVRHPGRRSHGRGRNRNRDHRVDYYFSGYFFSRRKRNTRRKNNQDETTEWQRTYNCGLPGMQTEELYDLLQQVGGEAVPEKILPVLPQAHPA